MSHTVSFPHQDEAREAYYAAFARAASGQNLRLNRTNYGPVVIDSFPNFLDKILGRFTGIAAVVESDADVADEEDLYNYHYPWDHRRDVKGLRISVLDPLYISPIGVIAKVMGGVIGEEVEVLDHTKTGADIALELYTNRKKWETKGHIY